MILKEKKESYNSWRLSLILVVVISLGLVFYKYSWTLICLGGGLISIGLIYFDTKNINSKKLESPVKKTILLYFLRYLIYIGYMLIFFYLIDVYAVIPAAIGLSIPRLCLIIYCVIKGGEAI